MILPIMTSLFVDSLEFFNKDSLFGNGSLMSPTLGNAFLYIEGEILNINVDRSYLEKVTYT